MNLQANGGYEEIARLNCKGANQYFIHHENREFICVFFAKKLLLNFQLKD